ncbi:MAG: hypothetical protein ABIP68_02955, partial [Ferruginibacter sp.]
MRLNFTRKIEAVYLKKWLFLFISFSLINSSLWSQALVNGNLNTGGISSNGVAAPAGFTWSEVQNGNESAGFSANVDNEFSISDDFIIPEGEVWNLTNINFFAYSTNYTGTSSPFNTVRLQIFSTDPSTGSPVPIFGDLISNRFISSASAGMYRIFNAAATPGNQRKIWNITASAGTTLASGHYWIEWQLGTIAVGASNFAPSSTVVGTVTQEGNNAMQHTLSNNTWAPVLDGTNPQDMPFTVNYTISCTNPTVPGVGATPLVICVGQSSTLSV